MITGNINISQQFGHGSSLTDSVRSPLCMLCISPGARVQTNLAEFAFNNV